MLPARPSTLFSPSTTLQIRHATLIRRPKRPYTFTQLITLSDGSTFLHRTTSPEPVYRSTKDTKNTPLWNPSSQKLLNIEEDEAGKLRRFRARFGRGYDVDAGESEDAEGSDVQVKVDDGLSAKQQDESLFDLITGFGKENEKDDGAGGRREQKQKSGKGKGGEK